MALFSKSIESAQNAVTKAESVVSEWEAKAAAARAEAARLDAESGAAILEDESAAERVTLNIQAHERRARAFDGAAAEARQKLHKARKEALEAEAREEDKESATLHKQSEAHTAKVAVLQKQLEDLDDCPWARASLTDSVTGRQYGEHMGRTGYLDAESERHAVRAAVIRTFIATGSVPNDYYDINNAVGTSFNGFARSIHDRDNIPASVLAARDAGLSFAAVEA
ncbi:hypothetical protein [Arthrobacter sp. ISL-69]|uniref:hypothetical protein n=1 Tax=Arthrobacter sp. ISL-69 TaxID=2819113 RepID=UPI001BE9530C|nr:hypothetical protein [Arthrobacter sp. ISL-69]MBT2538683.1 hypothetical protein [Arthrobacter sp. ISL-69]